MKKQDLIDKVQQGITLIEIMVVITIIGILTAIGVPSYQDMIERNQLKQAAESLKSDMQFARTEAIKRSVDVVVSRTPGNAGAWCYGLNTATACDCGTVGSCTIKTVLGSDFGSAVNMASANNNSSFDHRRGTTGAGGITFSTSHYAARVFFGDVGRVRICTPSGSTGLSGYPACP